MIFPDGTIKEGNFENNIFVGPTSDQITKQNSSNITPYKENITQRTTMA
jgi:hypothetical protein